MMGSIVHHYILLLLFIVAPSIVHSSSSSRRRNGHKPDKLCPSIGAECSRNQDCCRRFVCHEDGGRKLKYANAARTFVEAERDCSHWGGHIITTTFEGENKFLFEKMKARKVDIWLGLTDEESEGTWVTLQTKQTPTFKYWAPGEPYSGQRKNCASMGKGDHGLWSARSCNEKLHYVCRKDSAKEIEKCMVEARGTLDHNSGPMVVRKSWKECSEYCDTQWSCHGWTYMTNNQQCYVKDRNFKKDLGFQLGAVSGLRGCQEECKFQDMNIVGHDLGSVFKKTWQECSFLCAITRSCFGWTFDADGYNCQLKDGTFEEGKTPRKGSLSGAKGCGIDCHLKDINFSWRDLREIKLEYNASWYQCSELCDNDHDCIAWTYVQKEIKLGGGEKEKEKENKKKKQKKKGNKKKKKGDEVINTKEMKDETTTVLKICRLKNKFIEKYKRYQRGAISGIKGCSKESTAKGMTIKKVYKYCDTPNAFQKNPGYEVVPDMEAIMEEWGEKYHNHDFATDHITQAILDEW